MKRIIIFIVLLLAALPGSFAAQIFYEPFDSLSTIQKNGGTFNPVQSVFEQGKVGNALHTKGGEFVTYPINSVNSLPKGTIEFLFKTSYTPDTFGVMELDSNGGWAAGNDYVMGFVLYSSLRSELNLEQTSLDFAKGIWHHAAFTWDCGPGGAQKFSVSIDGYTFYGDSCGDSATFPKPLQLSVGKSEWYGSGETVFDEFKIFDYAKSPSEISSDSKSYGIISCYKNSDCGTDGWLGLPRCSGNNVNDYYETYKCENPGTTLAKCSSDLINTVRQTCISGCSNDACTTTLASECSQSVPLYRFYYRPNGAHFYTRSEGEKAKIMGLYGWVYEGISGYVFASQKANTIPLYRFWNAKAADHFYTISSSEASKVASLGWTNEGIAGYVYKNQATNTIPLYRFWLASNNQHFYTNSESERIKLSSTRWVFEGKSGFVCQNQTN